MLAISQQEERPFQHIPTNIQHLGDNAKNCEDLACVKINFNCWFKGYSINGNLFPMNVKIMELKQSFFLIQLVPRVFNQIGGFFFF